MTASPPIHSDREIPITAAECKAWLKLAKQKVIEAEEAVQSVEGNPVEHARALAAQESMQLYYTNVIAKVEKLKDKARRQHHPTPSQPPGGAPASSPSAATPAAASAPSSPTKAEAEHGGGASAPRQTTDAIKQMEEQLRIERLRFEMEKSEKKRATEEAREAVEAATRAKEEARRESKRAIEDAAHAAREVANAMALEKAKATAKKLAQGYREAASEELQKAKAEAAKLEAEARAAKAAAADAQAALDELKAECVKLTEGKARAERQNVNECPMCLDELDRDGACRHALVPCGHSMCATCAPDLVGGPCPVCMNVATASLRVY